MKISILLVFILLPQLLFSQNFYISAGGAYNLPVIKAKFDTENSVSNNSVKNVKGSMGKGYTGHLKAGYIFKNRLIAELQLSQLHSTEKYYNETKASMTRIIPTIKMAMGNKLQFIIGVGGVIGFKPSIEFENEYYMGPNDSYISKEKYTEGNSYGFYSEFCANYYINPKFSVGLDFNCIIQNWAPEKGVKEVEVSGRGAWVAPRPGTYEYSDEITIEPYQLLKFYLPFNSAGFGINLSYHFVKNNKSENK